MISFGIYVLFFFSLVTVATIVANVVHKIGRHVERRRLLKTVRLMTATSEFNAFDFPRADDPRWQRSNSGGVSIEPFIVLSYGRVVLSGVKIELTSREVEKMVEDFYDEVSIVIKERETQAAITSYNQWRASEKSTPYRGPLPVQSDGEQEGGEK